MFVEVRDATKVIKGVPVLEDVTLGFERGRIYGVRGKNGSGKTMLLRLIAGLMVPTNGSVTVGGKRLGRDISFPPSIGALIENPSFISNYTGFANLKSLADIQGKIGSDEIRETVCAVGLDPADRRPFRKYSLGMKQRLGIACAVMERPEMVLLDEPYNALDDTAVDLTTQIIIAQRERGALVVIASHGWDYLERIVDEVIDMKGGHVTARKQAV